LTPTFGKNKSNAMSDTSTEYAPCAIVYH